MGELSAIRKELRATASKEKAAILSRFFKTGKGEYGEGDRFLGVVVPAIRGVVKRHAAAATDEDLADLLSSPIHEERLCGFLAIVFKYERAARSGDAREHGRWFDFYVAHKERANNWDLVDLSAANVVGEELRRRGGDIALLEKLALSPLLWDRRIAIVSTFAFIKNGSNKECFTIAKLLLNDRHDLIHKAVGWMLRETGKRVSEPQLEAFLKPRHKTIPRTMLRYAIERLPEPRRKTYLKSA